MSKEISNEEIENEIENEEIEDEVEEIEEALEEAEENESEDMPKWVKQMLETQTAILNNLNQRPQQTQPNQEVDEIEVPKPPIQNQEQEAEQLEQEAEALEQEAEALEQEAEALKQEAPKESKLKKIAKYLF